MTYEVKTPLILESIEAVRYAINGLKGRSMEPREAAVLISGGRTIQNGVAQDVKARLAAPKIAMAEAKLIEQEGQKDQARLSKRE